MMSMTVAIGSLVCCTVAVIWINVFVRSLARARRGVRQYRGLVWHHQGRCAACGYDLRANAGRCPECGAAPAVPRLSPRSLDHLAD